MRSIPSLNPGLFMLILLGSCTSPPKPPTVDESAKRPANTAMAVELQVCKNDLRNTSILAAESNRLAESTTATLERIVARQQSVPDKQPAPAGNSVFAVHFDFASTHAAMASESDSTLIDEARTAPLVVLRGRTDGVADTPIESRIARDRANDVRNYLVNAGVDPARIRTTYQPIGDHVAANTSPVGRAMNRRVEIEVYRTPPVVMSPTTGNRQ